ncbi:MAG: hypothetical protein M1820_006152 [Bogoriella megaspora]|nr:MAG: hypothetical protein M1820_006152 [Bogoriella megaspora]
MDPLSITASLISVGGALKASLAALEKLVALKYASAELLELQNEVQSLRGFVKYSNSMLCDNASEQLSPDAITLLEEIVARLRANVQELENMSQYQLKGSEIPNKDGTPKVDRLNWIRLNADIVKVKRNIRDARQDLKELSPTRFAKNGLASCDH